MINQEKANESIFLSPSYNRVNWALAMVGNQTKEKDNSDFKTIYSPGQSQYATIERMIEFPMAFLLIRIWFCSFSQKTIVIKLDYLLKKITEWFAYFKIWLLHESNHVGWANSIAYNPLKAVGILWFSSKQVNMIGCFLWQR